MESRFFFSKLGYSYILDILRLIKVSSEFPLVSVDISPSGLTIPGKSYQGKEDGGNISNRSAFNISAMERA